MPAVKDITISARQKKLMYAEMLSELELCSTLEELEYWIKEFEQEIETITDKQQDDHWIEVIGKSINQQKHIIKLKGELDICQQ